ncbi:MAG: alpha/beta fold hydrolase [Nitrospiraceae bacterium]|nr:alpha/beta fold hydrolase [Nitrospiraceae bacterium]
MQQGINTIIETMPFPKDLKIVRGRKGMPWAVFIHGLGVGREIWDDPSQTRILGGLFTVSSIIRENCMPGGREKSLFHDLSELGYSTLTWDIERPAQEMAFAVRELEGLMGFLRDTERPEAVVLIGHSRGGLIARKYLEKAEPFITGYVSLSAPHHGSSLAKWAEFVKPAARFLGPLVSGQSRAKIPTAARRILKFMGSPVFRELLPGSEFFSSLGSPSVKCKSISAGGTDPHLFSVMGMDFPGVMGKILPAGKILPDEIRPGRGDGLVSARSAIYPHAEEHLDFPVNHVEVVLDKRVRQALVERIVSFN